jgi:ABC-type spermidine/putrescine transport system permease subunit II
MVESQLTRLLLRLGAGVTLAFIYLPLILVAFYAFNESITQRWPIDDFSTKWVGEAYRDPAVRDALLLSLQAARLRSPSCSGRSSRSPWRASRSSGGKRSRSS